MVEEGDTVSPFGPARVHMPSRKILRIDMETGEQVGVPLDSVILRQACAAKGLELTELLPKSRSWWRSRHAHPIRRRMDSQRRAEELQEVMAVYDMRVAALAAARKAARLGERRPKAVAAEVSTIISSGMERMEKVMEARVRRRAKDVVRSRELQEQASRTEIAQMKREEHLHSVQQALKKRNAKIAEVAEQKRREREQKYEEEAARQRVREEAEAQSRKAREVEYHRKLRQLTHVRRVEARRREKQHALKRAAIAARQEAEELRRREVALALAASVEERNQRIKLAAEAKNHERVELNRARSIEQAKRLDKRLAEDEVKVQEQQIDFEKRQTAVAERQSRHIEELAVAQGEQRAAQANARAIRSERLATQRLAEKAEVEKAIAARQKKEKVFQERVQRAKSELIEQVERRRAMFERTKRRMVRTQRLQAQAFEQKIIDAEKKSVRIDQVLEQRVAQFEEQREMYTQMVSKEISSYEDPRWAENLANRRSRDKAEYAAEQARNAMLRAHDAELAQRIAVPRKTGKTPTMRQLELANSFEDLESSFQIERLRARQRPSTAESFFTYSMRIAPSALDSNSNHQSTAPSTRPLGTSVDSSNVSSTG